mmetsp:Transcript_32351/g.42637  ORF Transcript_32351/g.42637 Transcript_32351/m.42637 type:complete len:729 (-) Transcript_32351:276-2462(-)
MGAGASSSNSVGSDDWAKELADRLDTVETENMGDDTRNHLLREISRARNVLTNKNVKATAALDKNLIHTAHHTSKFDEAGYLIVRRGQAVDFEVNYSADVDFEGVSAEVSLKGVTSKAKVHVPSVQSFDEGWGAKVEVLNQQKVKVSVSIPPDAAVGQFKPRLRVATDHRTDKLDLEEPWVILFNPWCEEDEVFMEDDNERREYTEAEDGVIYVGSGDRPSPRAWAFSQFSQPALECALVLMKGWSLRDRATPILVSRKLSALVNAQDDDGVLVGNWSGDYEGGERPTAWTGSEKILAHYLQYRRPVCYGQCWVFSGVLTTVLRTVGIPARSVTCFDSAHDCQLNRMVDKFFTRIDGELSPAEEMTEDSIWNFHVWNDCWMARHDLPPGRGGWQAVDATPQEVSGGKFQCGPASLVSIKAGEKNAYDNDFLIGEVNADVRYWEIDNSGSKPPRLIRVDQTRVGTKVLTKAVGKYEELDITDLYKHKEGTLEERNTLLRYDRELPTDDLIDFEIERVGELKVGEAFGVRIKPIPKPAASSNLETKIKIIAKKTGYSGISPVEVLKTASGTVKCNEAFELLLTPDDYAAKLNDTSFPFEFTFFGDVVGENQNYMESVHVVLEAPILQMGFDEVNLSTNPNSKASCEVRFTNPVQIELTNAVLMVEGRGILAPQVFKVGNIPPNGEVVKQIEVNAWLAGTFLFIGELETDQITDIKGSVVVDIQPGEVPAR